MKNPGIPDYYAYICLLFLDIAGILVFSRRYSGLELLLCVIFYVSFITIGFVFYYILECGGNEE